MNILKKKLHYVLLAILAVLFFLTTSYFNYKTQEFQKPTGEGFDFVKWTSPDETANYVFTKYYAQENKLIIRENYNLIASDIMRPRSFRSDHGDIKPVSFLGIILVYGSIAKVFSYRVIPFLTPLFASFGLIFFYLLVRKIFNKENALMSTFLLAFFPPYVYYTIRSMFHNVLFTVFLIIGLYFGFKMVERYEGSKKKTIMLGLFFAMLSGLFFGLSIITRTSELMWILPMLLIIWVLNIKKIGIWRLPVFLGFVFVALLPVLYYNSILYSSPLSGGYSEMNSSIQALKDSGAQIVKTTVSGSFENYSGIVSKIKETLFYFGIHPRQSARMFLYYFVEMFDWLFWLGSAGVLLFIARFKKSRKEQWVFLLSWLSISFILVIYYGSWTFYDNPDPRSHTIGNSYTRYWLPFYLGMIPFFVYLITQVTRWIARAVISNRERTGHVFFNFHISRKFFANAMRAMIIVAVFFWSANFLLAGSEEGLVYLYEKSTRTREEWQELMRLTESNSVLITRYHDKLVFPERKVIVGDFTDPNMVTIYSELSDSLPVYYYNFTFPEKDFEYLNTRKLVKFGFQLQEIKKLNYDFTLYKLVKIK